MTVTNPDDASAYCSLGGACYLGTVFTDTVATITLVLEVDADFAGDQLVNSATVSADQTDPNTDNNFDDETTAITTEADLSITKVDFVDPVIAGETLLYELVVTNDGSSDAQNVVITDTLDTRTTLVGSDATCTESPTGTVVCEIGDLAAGASRSILIEVRVDDDLTDPTTLTNNAEVSSDTPDSDTSNNDTDEGNNR